MGKSEHKNELWYLVDSKLLTSLPYSKKKNKKTKEKYWKQKILNCLS